jgi:hypothetical protein
MRCCAILLLVAAASAIHSDRLQAQGTPNTACSYSVCALRVERGLFGSRLVRGATGEPVGRLRGFGSGVAVLLRGSDSAAYYARQFRGLQQTSGGISVVSAVLAIAALTQGRNVGSATLLIAATTLELIAFPHELAARRSLDRAVWWYNRDLPRP